MSPIPRLLAVNLLGIVEHPTSGPSPFRIGRDGRPYVPVGDGGIVLGPRLGDGVFAHQGDHVAAGVCLVHPDPAARAGLTGLACVGNPATVRTGNAAGALGTVIGKRGEDGRVVVHFSDEVRAALRPGDAVMVRAEGQGLAPEGCGEVTLHNLAAPLLGPLGIEGTGDGVRVGVRSRLPSHLMGNGIGRPARQWCLDLQVDETSAAALGAEDLSLGDLVALDDVDARWNIGRRRGWTTVGLVVHGGSPLPGHGPGITPLLTGPLGSIAVHVAGKHHRGLTVELAEEAGRLLVTDSGELLPRADREMPTP